MPVRARGRRRALTEQQFQQLSAGLHEQRCDLIHSSRSMISTSMEI
jgi:hypothetical protein